MFGAFDSDGATFSGNNYPDSLKLYEPIKSDYQNKHRPFIDVDFYLKGKVIESKETTISDDYVPVTYYWLFVNTKKGIANCKVVDSIYNKYDVGNKIGVDTAKPKAEINQGNSDNTQPPQDDDVRGYGIIVTIFIAFISAVLLFGIITFFISMLEA